MHGGFVDRSGWKGVYHILKKDGFYVIAVQNSTISLTDDVAVTKRAIIAAKGDVVLVGHSNGGVVISEAGNDPKVTSLVYITALAPDKGESVSLLIANPSSGRRLPVPRPGKVCGFARCRLSFVLAAFMGDPQIPRGLEGPQGDVSEPAATFLRDAK